MTKVEETPYKKFVGSWETWVRQRIDLWSHIHVSGVLLWQGSSWINAASSFVLSDRNECDPPQGLDPYWSQEVCVFRVPLKIDVLNDLLKGLEEGVLAAGLIPGISDQIVFNAGRQVTPIGDSRMEPPLPRSPLQPPYSQWPNFSIELRSGSLADQLGPDFYRRLEAIDSHLAAEGHGTISEVAVRLSVRTAEEHHSSFGTAVTTARLIAPLQARVSAPKWDDARSSFLCRVDIASSVPRHRIRVVLGDPAARSQPVPLPADGDSPLSIELSSLQPDARSKIRLIFDNQMVQEIPTASLNIRSQWGIRDPTTEGQNVDGVPSEGDVITPDVFESAFGTYRRRKQLGQGGVGRVFAVEDADNEPFAIKVIGPEVRPEALKRFKNELFFCSENVHENIVRVIDWGFVKLNESKYPFYVMERFPDTLRTILKKAITPQRALQVFDSLLDGIEAAHTRGVWHRDLKPENVLISDHRVVIADFGAAHFSAETISTTVNTELGSRLANFRYGAPEQRDGRSAVDRRADFYALGLILNEMFTGTVPQGSGFRRIEDRAPNYAYLDEIVGWMIQQDPAKRPSGVRDIRNELERLRKQFVPRNPSSRAESTVPQEDPLQVPGQRDVDAAAPDVESLSKVLGLSPAALTVGMLILRRQDELSGLEPTLTAEEFGELNLSDADLNDAVADLAHEGLVKPTATLSTPVYRVQGTYHLAKRFGQHVLFYDPEDDIRRVAQCLSDAERLDGRALQARTGLTPLRLNRAVAYLKDGSHADVRGIDPTSSLSFDWAGATAATKRLLRTTRETSADGMKRSPT